ncbi:outer membrane biogenesis protein BamB [Rosistilla ulvae]|uniref:Outer membrane biogenesis protein BamB n=1 Tax=Rosistilla ulvae TaxID=1930277 RepID=A0A517LWI5_9BACT|nr:PQQ-binding-like beta-propeller repeat protein [Rosistilla ulvae]QDS86978.1 outer membrane biogenesis protein BamB [Rosistilla ulvae]
MKTNDRLPMMVKILCLFLPATALFGQSTDWPQWRGPHRDGKAAEQALLQQWPEGGPKLKWTFRDCGVGYSGFSIVGDQLFTMGLEEGQCYVIAVKPSDGSELWRTPIGPAAKEDAYLMGWGGGPRSTPTVDGDHLYALSDTGVLACLKTADGELVWKVSLVDDFGGSIPKWGYSESALIDGDRVIVTPGGKNFMIGLDKQTGKQIWGSEGIEAKAQYASVIKHTVDGITFYVTASNPGLIAVDATSGKQVFADTGTANGVAVIPTPIATGDFVYHTSAYDAGNTLVKLAKGDSGTLAVEPVYSLSKESKSMENHHGGVVLVDGVIYGFTKTNRGNWMAQDFQTGDTLWMESVGKTRSGSIAYADGRLYCYGDQDGSVVLAEPSRNGLVVKGKLVLPEQTDIDRGKGAIWAHPVIAGNTLFLRDQDLVFAFDLKR